MDTDRNLLFGVLALQADLLDPERFARACTLWSTQKTTPLADLLVRQGWLTAADRADVEKLLDRKLQKHQGDARAGLAEVTTEPVRQSLAAVADPDVRQSLAGIAPALGHVTLATTAYVPESRDRYTLSRLHATGGIGRVWLAHDPSLGRDVALKELRPETAGNSAVWARFLKEAQITGQLEHPGIVPIYEVGKRPDDQAPFYTMRFVRGRTLAEAVAGYHRKRAEGQAGPLELRELLGAFVGVCNAVAYAHSRGVLHRDLKPQNVVLGDFGEVIVLDWGLARRMDRAEADSDLPEVSALGAAAGTMQGQVLGTPAYMAPEQADGRVDQLGPATDVYGLGAVLYEVLAGRPPFAGADTAVVLRQVVNEPPARPGTLAAGTPRALEAVCLKALAKKPAARYPAAKALAAEVQRWLADEPPSAYREPWAARAGRWTRRHRTLVTGAAAAGLAALVGLALVLGVQARANQELAESNRQLANANRQLEQGNERERERFDLALEAIRTYHTGVSEDVLLKQEQFKDLRERLLRGAVEFYGKLEKLLEGQSDARSRRALGAAYYQVGNLIEKIGSKPEALKVHRQALAVRRDLAAEAGADAETRGDVAWSLLAVGRLQYAADDLAGALASFEEARGLAEGLAASGDPPDPILAVADRSLFNIAALLKRTGKRQEARAACERARAIQQRLTDAYPSVPDYQHELASSHQLIGLLLWDDGKRQEGLAELEKAQASWQKLADAYPAVPEYQGAVARCIVNTGVQLSNAGKKEEALARFEQAMAISQKLADAYPTVTDFQEGLATNHQMIGGVLRNLGQLQEALAAEEKGLAIRQKLADAFPKVTVWQNGVAWGHTEVAGALRALGRLDEARAHDKQAADGLKRLGLTQQASGNNAAAASCFRRALQRLARAHAPGPVRPGRLPGPAVRPGRGGGLGADGRRGPGGGRPGHGHAAAGGHGRLPQPRRDADRPQPRPAAPACGLSEAPGESGGKGPLIRLRGWVASALTPAHTSWLNQTEILVNALGGAT
jgi:eukaryotic-like serine/threonine-protein kinase